MRRPEPTRREMIAAAGAAGLMPLTQGVAAAAGTNEIERPIAQDLARYIGFGGKASGGGGDNRCGAWMQAEIEALGFAARRQVLSVPFFEPSRATLSTGVMTAAVLPQAIVVETGQVGVSGPLLRVASSGQPERALQGAIALIDLPFARWSSALAKPVQSTVNAALSAGAKAAVLVTTGPSGQALALNADGNQPMFDKPVAVLAPEDAAPFWAAAAATGEAATLHVTGRGGRRPAAGVIGKLDRGRGKWVIISTPRSGWFTCAGERGPGIAIWLELARWAKAALPAYDLAFIANSGHEYENLGSAHALETAVPKPAKTAIWLHLGANIAARDWQDLTGTLLPLPSADPQRYLVVSPHLLAPARLAFAGEPGLEVPYPSDAFSAGELTNILKAGYPSVVGVFGAHRFHHTRDDDARCVSAASVARALDGFQRLLGSVLVRR